MTDLRRRRLCMALPAALVLSGVARAAAPGLRFATLAPRGSLYHRALLKVGEAWRKAEGAGAAFTVFTDGVQGGEVDVVRRMRIGQLNGAMVTSLGLREIEPGAAALQFMPLTFRSWEELDAASARLRPQLENRMLERGFVVLYWGEAGWVRFFAKSSASSPQDFLRMKVACSAGAPEQADLMNAMGYHPVVLETADIMPGLQTGLIDALSTIPTLALAMQIDTAARFMLDMRWAPVTGAAVVTRKAWDSLSPGGQAAIREAAQQVAAELRAARESADTEAIQAMKKRGLTVLVQDEATRQAWEEVVAKVRPQIRGKLVPADMFDVAQQAVADFRGRKG
jgi:TRAP-type C4-dicarboxylate transport system substrate-binding protein